MRSPGWRVITQTIYSVLALRWPFLFTTNKSTHLSLCLSRPIRLSVRSSVDQFHIYPSVYLCLPACSSVCPLAYLSVYLPTYPAYHLFQIPVRHAGVRPGDLALDDHQSARLYEVPGFNDEQGRRQWRVFVAGRSGQATEVRRLIQPGCVPSVYPASRSLLHRLQCFFFFFFCHHFAPIDVWFFYILLVCMLSSAPPASRSLFSLFLFRPPPPPPQSQRFGCCFLLLLLVAYGVPQSISGVKLNSQMKNFVQFIERNHIFNLIRR